MREHAAAAEDRELHAVGAASEWVAGDGAWYIIGPPMGSCGIADVPPP